MTHLQEQDLFSLFQKKKSDFELYESVKKFIGVREHEIRGEENANFYDVLSQIHHSVNNAGHEERRPALISYIWKEQNKISDKYETFLP